MVNFEMRKVEEGVWWKILNFLNGLMTLLVGKFSI